MKTFLRFAILYVIGNIIVAGVFGDLIASVLPQKYSNASIGCSYVWLCFNSIKRYILSIISDKNQR
ncbi:MAG: hypothetical protein LBL45_02510 [Treponema sp.]|jgi:hypothetical protein|nr:hypothetical protein [Treponema sp.]